MITLSIFYLVAIGVAEAFVAYHGKLPYFPSRSRLYASTSKDLVQKLINVVEPLDRGFTCTAADRKRVVEILDELSLSNPTKEPGAAFYPEVDDLNQRGNEASVTGRWRLIYTDAPDIISLGENRLADLGRIGQECDEATKTISNVIEWSRPSWLQAFPFADDQVEQRVVLRASANRSAPMRIQLFVEGFDFVPQKLLGNSMREDALRIRGPLSGKIPFGAFDVLYLDDTLRAVRTVPQGFYAINIRDELS